MARLTMSQRKAMSKEDFAIPERAPGHGSYPIQDTEHVKAALEDCHHGKPGDCERVESAVHHKYGIRVHRAPAPSDVHPA